jgi:energy-coupling factor transporter transmembrane protein EcfT
MRQSILQTNSDARRGPALDPRTKFLLLITMAVFVLGGAGSAKLSLLNPVLCLVPFVLLLLSRRVKTAAVSRFLYVSVYLVMLFVVPHTTGLINFLILGSGIVVIRLLPGILTGMYVLSGTTVSEFMAAMRKMRVSEKLVIPFSVMFRFFPTVMDEYSSIKDAMRMRGVSFGSGNAGKMLEYRLVPLMTCSVRIGEELSAAALTRGLGGNVRRTNVCRIGFHFADAVVLTLCAAPYAGLLLAWCGVL